MRKLDIGIIDFNLRSLIGIKNWEWNHQLYEPFLTVDCVAKIRATSSKTTITSYEVDGKTL